MSDALYMIELRPVPAALIRFAEDQGINRRADENLGYAVHAWLAAMFGKDAPKPFRLLQDRSNLQPARLLGFSRKSGEDLAEQAQTFASPLAMAVCRFDDAVPAKRMPDQWHAGRRLGFELLACPISRLGRNEDDVYRRHRRECDGNGKDPDSRPAVYRAWLERQLGEAAALDDYNLQGFRNLRLLRRAADAGRRDFLAPQASFSGVLRVRDGEAFQHLLARGVGRHRSFGFGMLLLRPAP